MVNFKSRHLAQDPLAIKGLMQRAALAISSKRKKRGRVESLTTTVLQKVGIYWMALALSTVFSSVSECVQRLGCR